MKLELLLYSHALSLVVNSTSLHKLCHDCMSIWSVKLYVHNDDGVLYNRRINPAITPIPFLYSFLMLYILINQLYCMNSSALSTYEQSWQPRPPLNHHHLHRLHIPTHHPPPTSPQNPAPTVASTRTPSALHLRFLAADALLRCNEPLEHI